MGLKPSTRLVAIMEDVHGVKRTASINSAIKDRLIRRMNDILNFREKTARRIMLKHIQAFKYEPNPETPGKGMGYFRMDERWYQIVKFIAGTNPENLLAIKE